MIVPRPVWQLGWVSFFTDTASEMIYPLLPLFLTRVLGASAMSLGVIEGVAEAANSILKVWSGRMADRTQAPKRLVLAGYAISSLTRPFIGAASTWGHVLTIRFVDRLGKGIRGAPRDAMLAAFATPANRGRVFGLHRAMDHGGAVLGPLLASLFLYFYPEEYRTLFMLTIVPAIVVMGILFRVPEPAGIPLQGATAADAGSAPSLAAASLPRELYRALAVIVLFSLGNASDAFLILRLGDLGVAAFWLPLLWSALHVVKTIASAAGGELSDRFGRRTLIALGWIVYAIVYAAFGALVDRAALVVVFLAYGVYFGLTEGVEKAWVADLTPRETRGAAFGLYNAAVGIGALAASLLFGAIWTRVSPAAAFYTGSSLAAAATLLLYLLFSPRPHEATR
jgi:MFS family permease